MSDSVDIRENEILAKSRDLLRILLVDRSKSKYYNRLSNITWATSDYESLGSGYKEFDEISIEAISGENGLVIQPRTKKSKLERRGRSREKAEVFTPSWLCNEQNNLVDNAWFGVTNVFNVSHDKSWQTFKRSIPFPTKDGKTWKDYVLECRLEITCGEAPYLVSRYDTITGNPIALLDRIGLLDRKIRVVNENVSEPEDWLHWVKIAYKSIYAFELQGDNLLLARENLLYTFIDNYVYMFSVEPELKAIEEIANIISWNVWQMDGLKTTVPNSCHDENIEIGGNLFEPVVMITKHCQGCEYDSIQLHNGIYCIVMDWEHNVPIEFRSLLKE